MSNVSNNSEENVLMDQKYDGFEKFVLDGRDQSRYQYFRRGVICKVDKGEFAIVVNELSPSGPKGVRLVGPGWHLIDPVFEKFIYVPNPEGPVVLNFKPYDDQDKKMNFTFTPGMFSNSDDINDADRDEVTLDYKVKVQLVDPIRYFYNREVIQNLRAEVVSILREYVAKSNKKDFFGRFSNLSLNVLDPTGRLREYERKYGLKVIKLDVDNIKLSDAVQEARNASAVKNEEINQARYDLEKSKIEAESEMQFYLKIFEMAKNKGLNTAETLEFMNLCIQGRSAKNPNAHVFIGSRGMNDYAMMLAMYGGSRLGNSDNSNVIDAQYSEEFDKAPMLGNNNGRRRKR